MVVQEKDLNTVLGDTYESCYCEFPSAKGEYIKLFVKRNAAKGVAIVQWEFAGHSQWSFNKDCADKTANDMAGEIAEYVKGAQSYNDLSIRIFQYSTPF